MNIVLSILLFVAAIFLIVAVLLQSGKDNKLSGAITGASGDTFLGKSKGNTLDKKLNMLTIIVAVVFVILVMVVYVGQNDTDLSSLETEADNAATTVAETEVVTSAETTAETAASTAA